MKIVSAENGFEAPAVGLGTYHLLDRYAEPDAVDAILAAYNAGIELVDTSDNYGSELAVGQALRDLDDRSHMIIATKTGLATSLEEHLALQALGRPANTSPERILEQLSKSLRMLGTSSIYLYQLHAYDPFTTAADVAGVMHQITEEEGRAQHYGVSNYELCHLETLLETCDKLGLRRPSTFQPAYNMLTSYGVQGAIDLAMSEGMVVLAHTPLLKGYLADQMARDYLDTVEGLNPRGSMTQEVIDTLVQGGQEVMRLHEYANTHGHTLSEFAIAWLLSQPQTVVLNACLTPQNLQSTLRAAEWELDDEALALAKEVRQNPAVLQSINAMLTLASQSKHYYRKR